MRWFTSHRGCRVLYTHGDGGDGGDSGEGGDGEYMVLGDGLTAERGVTTGDASARRG